MRNKERTNHQSGWHNRGSDTQGTKDGNQWYPEPQNDTIKGGSNQH